MPLSQETFTLYFSTLDNFLNVIFPQLQPSPNSGDLTPTHISTRTKNNLNSNILITKHQSNVSYLIDTYSCTSLDNVILKFDWELKESSN